MHRKKKTYNNSSPLRWYDFYPHLLSPSPQSLEVGRENEWTTGVTDMWYDLTAANGMQRFRTGDARMQDKHIHQQCLSHSPLSFHKGKQQEMLSQPLQKDPEACEPCGSCMYLYLPLFALVAATHVAILQCTPPMWFLCVSHSTFHSFINSSHEHLLSTFYVGFPGGSDGKVSACNVGDPDSIPGLGRSPGEGNGNPLQYSCLANSMDGEAW